MIDYTELKRLAEKSKDSWVNGKWHTRPTLDIWVDEDDSAYITAASPDVVLSMIAEIDRLCTQNQALVEALKECKANAGRPESVYTIASQAIKLAEL